MVEKSMGPIMARIPKYYPEGDADTLAESAAIRANPTRMRNAKKAAAAMIDEKMIKAKALKRIAKKSGAQTRKKS